MKKLLTITLLLTAFIVSIFMLNNDKVSAQDNPVVVFQTSYGDIELTLMPDVAPKTCENFLGHINSGYYNGVIFHRVIKNFMIQTGDPTGTGRGGESIWGSNFEDEVSPNVAFTSKGILAMANRGPNTNGSQFFITTAATPWLNMKHTIFGKVTSGYDIVDIIQNVAVDSRSSKPLEKVEIINVYVK